MKKLFALVALTCGVIWAQNPVVRLSYVVPFNAVTATATHTSTAIRIPNLSGYGTLTLTGSGITGSPSGCQIALEYQQSTGTTASSAFATQSFTPSNAYQSFTIAPSAGFASGDTLIAVYTCSVYPTAGTLTATFDPSVPVNVQGTVPVSGTFWQATQPVSGTVGISGTVPVSGTFWQATQPVSAASLPLPSGAATSAKQPALGTAGTASTDVLTVQGITSMTPLKVDGSGVTQPVSGTFWQVTQPISAASLPLPSGASTAAKQPALGTAGSPSTDVLTVQGATSMTALKVDGSATTQPVSGTVTVQQSTASSLKVDLSGTGANTTAIKVDNSAVTQPISGSVSISGTPSVSISGTVADPCQANAKSFAVINLTANTQIITAGGAGTRTYFCSLNLIASAATNVALVEGTGTTCATGITGMAGGSTAATGWNFAANGGIALGNGAASVMATAGTAKNVCILVSAANQISGSIAYVQQ